MGLGERKWRHTLIAFAWLQYIQSN